MPRFSCPACKSMFEVAPEHVGLAVRCPRCGAVLGTSLGTRTGPGRPAGDATSGATTQIGGEPAGQVPPAGAPGYPPPFIQPTYPPGQPMPGTYGYPPMMYPPPPGPNAAGLWAFLLSLVSWALVCGGVISFGSQFDLQNESGQALFRDALADPPAWLTALGHVGRMISVAAFALAVVAIARPNRRKGLAITALLIAGLPLAFYALTLVGQFAMRE